METRPRPPRRRYSAEGVAPSPGSSVVNSVAFCQTSSARSNSAERRMRSCPTACPPPSARKAVPRRPEQDDESSRGQMTESVAR